MKLGLVLPMATGDTDRVLEVALRAEELGFDGLFAFDHFFPPGAPSDRPSLEAYAMLAAVAAVTTGVAIGTLVTRASLRPAGMLARQAAALDEVSRGRFVLGIGSGDAVGRAEHQVFGLPYLDPSVRRVHLSETVGAVRALFEGRPWPGGDHVPALAGPLLPPPRTIGGPPVWVGGTSEAAVALAGEMADGWNGWGLSPQVFAERVRLLESRAVARRVEPTWGGAGVVGLDDAEAERLVEARRQRGLGQAFAGGVEAAVAWLEQLRESGATWAILLVAGPSDRLELVGERIVPALRGAA